MLFRSGDEYGADDDSADEIEDYLEEMDEDVDRPQEQKLHEHYSMEKQDPTHRMGDLMTAAETIYNEARGGRRRDEFACRSGGRSARSPRHRRLRSS